MNSGDRCPRTECSGRLKVRTSKRSGSDYVRYLDCDACDYRTTSRVPADTIHRRSKRKWYDTTA